MTGPYRLTPYQAEEVGGLLAVCADEAASSGDRTPWGEVILRDGTWWLTVTDPVDAADDLRWRADYFIEEGAVVGPAVTGVSGARSLRHLAETITAGGDDG